MFPVSAEKMNNHSLSRSTATSADYWDESVNDAEVVFIDPTAEEISRMRQIIENPVITDVSLRDYANITLTLIFAAKISHWQTGHHVLSSSNDGGYVWNVIKRHPVLSDLQNSSQTFAVLHSLVHTWSTIGMYSFFIECYNEDQVSHECENIVKLIVIKLIQVSRGEPRTAARPKVLYDLYDPLSSQDWAVGTGGRMPLKMGPDMRLRLNQPGEGTRKFTNVAVIASKCITHNMLHTYPLVFSLLYFRRHQQAGDDALLPLR